MSWHLFGNDEFNQKFKKAIELGEKIDISDAALADALVNCAKYCPTVKPEFDENFEVAVGLVPQKVQSTKMSVATSKKESHTKIEANTSKLEQESHKKIEADTNKLEQESHTKIEADINELKK